MKKSIIFFSAFIIIAIGCSKKLDILPTQSIDETQVFTSDENIKAALNGAYDAASNTSLLGGDLQLYSELLGADDEIAWVGTYNEPDEVYAKAILTNNSYVRATWAAAYNTINICNNILNAIDIVNDDDRDKVKGEALFLRGVMYFELVKLFAKPYSAGNVATNLGVQIVTTPTIGDISAANRVPRSTVQQTYDLILDDLTQAKALLPKKNEVYATTYAASAILSRVYLQMEDYANARDEANMVIASGQYSLTDTYKEAFNNTSNSLEDIFAMQVTAQDDQNDMHLFWSIGDFGARDGDVEILDKHLNLYDSNDDRLALFYDDGAFYSGKWLLQYKNIPIIRLAEMYLTRAESNFRLGTAIGAAPGDDLDVIRERVGLPAIPVTLNNILLERRLELAHEGQRIHDVKRLKGSVDGFAYDANKLVFPIPIREINAVGPDVLKQNDGY